MSETTNSKEYLSIRVEFTGGLESLFNNQKTHDIQLPTQPQTPPTIGHLVQHLTQTFLADSPKREFFVIDDSVRPGILVLINDADWELEGEAACELKNGDEVVFVSTLHGG